MVNKYATESDLRRLQKEVLINLLLDQQGMGRRIRMSDVFYAEYQYLSAKSQAKRERALRLLKERKLQAYRAAWKDADRLRARAENKYKRATKK